MPPPRPKGFLFACLFSVSLFLTQKPVEASHKSNHDMALVVSHFTELTMVELLEPSEKVSKGHLDSEVLNVILGCWNF